jgi:hypothetical protein
MLLPEQVIPFLAHEDSFVRAQAARYFDRAHDPAPLTADVLWEAIDRFPPGGSANRLVGLLAGVPQTDASTDRLLAALGGREERFLDVEEDLWITLEDLEFEQLRKHRERVLAVRGLPRDVRDHLEVRLKLVELPAGALWDKLEKQSDKVAGKYWDDIDHAVGDRLVEALARHPESAERAVEMLDNEAAQEDMGEIYAIQILGRMRHRPAMERLLRTLRDCDEEDDVLHEQLMYNLPRIGGADVVGPVAARMPDEGQAYQVYAAGLLGYVKHPDAEAALVRLLKNPGLRDVRTDLAMALGQLCPTGEGLEALRRVVVEREFDEQVADLRQDLVASAMMAGVEFAEMGALREEAVAKEVEVARRLEAMERGQPDDEGFDEFGDGGVPPLPAELDDREPPVVAPIRRDEAKVGRNDPCPCGSGKKHKKCCLGKGA